MTDAPTKRMGRPPTGLPRMIRINVTLDQATIDRAQLLGGGYVSTGIREAVRRVRMPFEPNPHPAADSAPPASPDASPAGSGQPDV